MTVGEAIELHERELAEQEESAARVRQALVLLTVAAMDLQDPREPGF